MPPRVDVTLTLREPLLERATELAAVGSTIVQHLEDAPADANPRNITAALRTLTAVTNELDAIARELRRRDGAEPAAWA